MLYYIKCLFFYSFLGFTLESEVYKINNSNLHSGIFYGPITEVYGFGILALILLKKFFIDKIKCNKYLKFFITFILCFFILTFIEFIGGNILYLLFEINMWDYSNKEFNCGKYICLDLAVIWGIFGTLFIYYVKDYFDKFIKNISDNFTYVLIVINIIDTVMVFLTK